MTWNYVKQLKTSHDIMLVEEITNYRFEDGFVDCVICNNGARPNLKLFDTEYEKERVFKCLLSFNNKDTENIYDAIGALKQVHTEAIVPFGLDVFGNYLCFDKDNDNVIFFDHENGNVEWVANNFGEFLSKLY